MAGCCKGMAGKLRIAPQAEKPCSNLVETTNVSAVLLIEVFSRISVDTLRNVKLFNCFPSWTQ